MAKFKSLTTGLILEPSNKEVEQLLARSKQFIPYKAVRLKKTQKTSTEETEPRQEE